MRLLLKLIVLIVIVVIAGLIALPFIVDPNDYKQQISQQVEKATGRQLTLDGDIGLSVFPWIALELGSTTLSNAQGFTAPHFAKIDDAQIRIKLMPLLNKSLEMDTIVLNGLTLNLEKNKAGGTNWDDLGGQSSDDTTNKAQNKDEQQEPAAGLAALTIAGVQLSNANINWSDKSTGEHYTIEGFDLTTDPLIDGEPTAIDMQFKIKSHGKEQLAADIALTTSLLADLDKQLFTLSDVRFSTDAHGDAIPAIALQLDADIKADVAQQRYVIDQLSLQTTAEGDDLPMSKMELALNGNVKADLAQQTAELSGLVIQMADLTIESDIKATQITSDTPKFTGHLHLKPVNPRQLAQQLAIELPTTADGNVLELLQLSSQLSGSNDHISLTDLALTLDQSKLTGNVAVKQFAKPAIEFNLALDAINLDRYLPPSSDKETSSKAPASPATAGAAAASQLPVDVIKDLNLNGRLTIGELIASGTNSQNIDINVNAKNGAVSLHPLKAELYQGSYNGHIKLNAKGQQLALSIDEQLANVQAGPLLKDLTGDDKISGLVNGKVALTGQGTTVDGIKSTLSGQGNFSFTDGALKGINIADSIRKAQAVFKGQVPASSKEQVKTDFSSFTGSFTANNGVIHNPDLVLMSPLLRVNGQGDANLNNESIDYGLKVGIVGTAEGQLGKDLAELKGLVVPVYITGSFSQPKPKVDIATLVRDNATQKAKDKVTDKLKDKLGDELGGALGGALLGGSNKDSEPEATDTDAKQTTAPEDKAPASVEDKLKEELGNKLKGLF